MEKQIKDEYGKKIGGSRRDMWSAMGLRVSDLEGMDEFDRKKYAVKDNIWPKPNYQALKDEGRDVEAVYFIKTVRDGLAVRPYTGYQAPTNEDISLYVDGLSKVKELAMEVKSRAEIPDFRDKILKDSYFIPEENQRGYYLKPNRVVYLLGGSKFISSVQQTAMGMAAEVRKKRFLYDADQNALADIRPVYYRVSGCDEEFTENTRETDCMIRTSYGRTLIAGLSVKEGQAIPVGNVILCQNYTYIGNYPTKEEAEAKALALAKAVAAMKEANGTPKVKKGKKTFCYETLSEIRQTENGYPVLVNNMPVFGITGDKIVEDYGFWGSEFGNYLNQDERQKNLDLSYVSFNNFAKALGVKDTDISLGGKLSIAYGARGRGGNALAHFEPGRYASANFASESAGGNPVINLTKLKGAGSLGHELGHAVDFIKGAEFGANGSFFDMIDKGRSYRLLTICPEAYDVYKAMTRKDDGSNTDFYDNSLKMGRAYAKQGGYWESAVEMWARCFAVWLKDRLTSFGIVDDYLVGHADLVVGMDDNGNVIRAYPVGEEKERINAAIDKFIGLLFHSAEAAEKPTLEEAVMCDIRSIMAGSGTEATA